MSKHRKNTIPLKRWTPPRNISDELEMVVLEKNAHDSHPLLQWTKGLLDEVSSDEEQRLRAAVSDIKDGSEESNVSPAGVF